MKFRFGFAFQRYFVFSYCVKKATDTSSAASAFVALMLAMHPEYQEKVFQEILTVMPEKDTDLTQADLDKLEFTDLCIKETLRLYPSAPLIGRQSFKPIPL